MNIFCIGKNYLEHIKEFDNENPNEIVIFMKQENSVIQDDVVPIPKFTNDFHYELEIVLKVSQRGKHIPKQEAKHYFQELSLGIDFTARDVQMRLKKKSLPWEISKSFDGSAYLPKKWFNKKNLTTSLNDIHFSLLLEDKIVQQSTTKWMLYDFDTIISEISTYFTLNPGDIIFTGTPEGIGRCLPENILVGKMNNEEVFRITMK